ncbi:hypothetical protein BSKO_08800 [Bryopsis sp. KO-2023]|nr:hypothetical protein BSKO_08800 [Bryopsis sp. KO-2023]
MPKCAQHWSFPSIIRPCDRPQRRILTRVGCEKDKASRSERGPPIVCNDESGKVDLGIVGSPVFLISMLAGFSADAYDITAPNSLRLFSGVDWTIHEWVSTHVADGLPHIVFDRLLSDFFIVVPVILWILLDRAQSQAGGNSSGEVAKQEEEKGLGAYNGEDSISAGVYAGVGAAVTFSMMLSKEVLFPRLRPRPGLATLSFPSGHTMAAVMLTGMFLIRTRFEIEGLGADSEKDIPGWITWVYASGELLVVLSGIVTATGRIGADAHWLSDTVAGACLGLGAVSCVANIYRYKKEANS